MNKTFLITTRKAIYGKLCKLLLHFKILIFENMKYDSAFVRTPKYHDQLTA